MIRVAAWVYFRLPMWIVRCLPKCINESSDCAFNDAVLAEYNRWYKRERKRMGWPV